jgi:hypothetical protein
MKRLKDNALIGVAGFIAIALIATSGVIPGAFASDSAPSHEGNVSGNTVSPHPTDTVTQPTPEPEYGDGSNLSTETGHANDDTSPTDTVNVSSFHGAATIRASFTVGDPN